MLQLTEKQLFEQFTSKKIVRYDENGNAIKSFTSPLELDATRLYFKHLRDNSERVHKYKQKDKIVARVERMKNPLFITFTWDNNRHDLVSINQTLRKWFKANNINYVLVSDMGIEKKEHYHGFIDLPYNSELLMNVSVKGKGTIKAIKRFYDLGYYNTIQKLKDNNNDLKNAINYCVKYCVKEIDYKHRLFCSRDMSKITGDLRQSSNNYEITFDDLINDDLPF